MSLASDPLAARPAATPDVSATTRAMAKSVAVGMLATAALIALILALLGRGDWWQGFGVASLLSVLAAGVSIAAMRVGLGFGVHGAIAAHFAGVGLRLIVVLGGGLILVAAGGYPAAPTLLLCVPYYFATLAAEVVALARVFWNNPPSTTTTAAR